MNLAASLHLKIAGLFLSLSLLLFPTSAFAFDLFNPPSCAKKENKVCVCTSGTSASTCEDKNKGNENPTLRIIKSAANIIALAAGVAAVIMIIIGGFTLVTSSGNQESVANARRRILAAIIGLIIIALAWTITTFVITRLIN